MWRNSCRDNRLIKYKSCIVNISMCCMFYVIYKKQWNSFSKNVLQFWLGYIRKMLQSLFYSNKNNGTDGVYSPKHDRYFGPFYFRRECSDSDCINLVETATHSLKRLKCIRLNYRSNYCFILIMFCNSISFPWLRISIFCLKIDTSFSSWETLFWIIKCQAWFGKSW